MNQKLPDFLSSRSCNRRPPSTDTHGHQCNRVRQVREIATATRDRPRQRFRVGIEVVRGRAPHHEGAGCIARAVLPACQNLARPREDLPDPIVFRPVKLPWRGAAASCPTRRRCAEPPGPRGGARHLPRRRSRSRRGLRGEGHLSRSPGRERHWRRAPTVEGEHTAREPRPCESQSSACRSRSCCRRR